MVTPDVPAGEAAGGWYGGLRSREWPNFLFFKSFGAARHHESGLDVLWFPLAEAMKHQRKSDTNGPAARARRWAAARVVAARGAWRPDTPARFLWPPSA